MQNIHRGQSMDGISNNMHYLSDRGIVVGQKRCSLDHQGVLQFTPSDYGQNVYDTVTNDTHDLFSQIAKMNVKTEEIDRDGELIDIEEHFKGNKTGLGPARKKFERNEYKDVSMQKLVTIETNKRLDELKKKLNMQRQIKGVENLAQSQKQGSRANIFGVEDLVSGKQKANNTKQPTKNHDNIPTSHITKEKLKTSKTFENLNSNNKNLQNQQKTSTTPTLTPTQNSFVQQPSAKIYANPLNKQKATTPKVDNPQSSNLTESKSSKLTGNSKSSQKDNYMNRIRQKSISLRESVKKQTTKFKN